MKNIVLFDEYNEIDFKPSDLLHEYLRLTEKDVRKFFPKNKNLRKSYCPGCQSKEAKAAFLKFGMSYVECANCSTLYLSPRPDDAALSEYYEKSAARVFWHDELSKKTSMSRQEKIIRPRFQWILDSTQESLPGAEHIVDINTEQYGYIDELLKNTSFKRKTLLNPCIRLDNLSLNNSIDVVNDPSGGAFLKDKIDVVTLFEVADRTGDVDKLFGSIHDMLKTGGLCFMTDILISGFDLQTLWDKAENIFPPDRLNVFTVEGLNALFERHKFERLEFSTPGILDVEIVERSFERNPQVRMPKFIDYLLKNRSVECKRFFQEFLQENLLSSYARIVLRKI